MPTPEEALLAAILGHSRPSARRWYVARIYPGDDAEGLPESVDIYQADCTEDFEREVSYSQLSVQEFLASRDSDDLEWWEEEDFDACRHMPTDAFRSLLAERHHLLLDIDQPILEGQVFIELPSREDGGLSDLVEFTYQSREASKRVYEQLEYVVFNEKRERSTGEEPTEGSSHADA